MLVFCVGTPPAASRASSPDDSDQLHGAYRRSPDSPTQRKRLFAVVQQAVGVSFALGHPRRRPRASSKPRFSILPRGRFEQALCFSFALGHPRRRPRASSKPRFSILPRGRFEQALCFSFALGHPRRPLAPPPRTTVTSFTAHIRTHHHAFDSSPGVRRGRTDRARMDPSSLIPRRALCVVCFLLATCAGWLVALSVQ